MSEGVLFYAEQDVQQGAAEAKDMNSFPKGGALYDAA